MSSISRPALPAQLGIVAAAAISLLALCLRLRGITAESLWWDEVSSWQQARGSLPELIAATATDNYPPLHNLLIHFSMQMLGETEFALRLPSALLAALNVLAIYWVGSLVGSRAAGLLAAVLLAVSGYHIWYSQEARAYALLACAATLFAGTALSVAARPGWRRAIAVVLAGTALLYSHPYGALTWAAISAAIAVALLATRPAGAVSAWRFALLQAIPAVLFAPWALLLLGRARIIDATGFWIPQVSPDRVAYYLMQLLTGPFLLGATLIGIALACLPRLAPNRPRLLPAPGEHGAPGLPYAARLGVVLAWALVPLLLGIAASLLFKPVLVPRYLIGSLPAMLVLLALGATRLPRSPLSLVPLGGLALAAYTGFIGFGPPARDDFRSISFDLALTLRPGDCLLMRPESLLALSYYYRREIPCISTARNNADADFGAARPARILVLRRADEPTDDAALDALGERGDIKDFGAMRLLELTPRP